MTWAASKMGPGGVESPDNDTSGNKHTVDGGPAEGKGSFSPEKIEEINKKLDALRVKLVGTNGGTEGDAADNTAVNLGQNKELLALSGEYGIEIGAEIGQGGTIISLSTDYHHKRLWSNLPRAGSGNHYWHTHPGRTHIENIIGQMEDQRGFSSNDFLSSQSYGGKIYAAYPRDGSLYRMNAGLDGKIYEYSQGAWGYTGRRMVP